MDGDKLFASSSTMSYSTVSWLISIKGSLSATSKNETCVSHSNESNEPTHLHCSSTSPSPAMSLTFVRGETAMESSDWREKYGFTSHRESHRTAFSNNRAFVGLRVLSAEVGIRLYYNYYMIKLFIFLALVHFIVALSQRNL